MMREIKMNNYLKRKNELLTKVLEDYSKFDFSLKKSEANKNSSVFVDEEGTKYDVSPEMELFLKSFFHKNNRQTTNAVNKEARKILRNIDLIEKINYELENNGNQVVVEDVDCNYSNDLILENIKKDLVLDGSNYKNSKEIYNDICKAIGIDADSNLSNINPPQKTVVVITNYGKMLSGMTRDDQVGWVCNLRNCMENQEPLLFVLLNSNKEDNTFFLNGELVSRLIPMKN